MPWRRKGFVSFVDHESIRRAGRQAHGTLRSSGVCSKALLLNLTGAAWLVAAFRKLRHVMKFLRLAKVKGLGFIIDRLAFSTNVGQTARGREWFNLS